MRHIYIKEILEPIVLESYSIKEVLEKLLIAAIGGNYNTIKRKIKEFNIDISHFKGQSWNKGESGTDRVSKYPLSLILLNNTIYNSNLLKKRLIQTGLKENYCEECGLSGEDITLELHHIDGNHYNNSLENLLILCPNCHSKTSNFRNRNHKYPIELIEFRKLQKPLCICLNCGKEFYSDRVDKVRKFCSRNCYNEYLTKLSMDSTGEYNIKSLTREYFVLLCNTYSNLKEIANHLLISRPTVRKYLIKYDLYNAFKMKYDFHAKIVELYDMHLNFIKEWPSVIDAANSLKINKTDISECALHKRRSAGGYIWKYK